MKFKLLTLAIASVIASGAQASDLQFTTAPTPTSDLDKRSVLTSQFAMIDGEKVDVGYKTILRSAIN